MKFKFSISPGNTKQDQQEWFALWNKINSKLSAKYTIVEKMLAKLLHAAPGSIFINPLNRFEEPSDVSEFASIYKRGKFSDSGKAVRRPMRHSNCHGNVSALYQDKKIDHIVTGFALTTDGAWREHTWGLKDGDIVETTVRRLLYFGKVLDEKEADSFAENARDRIDGLQEM